MDINVKSNTERVIDGCNYIIDKRFRHALEPFVNYTKPIMIYGKLKEKRINICNNEKPNYTDKNNEILNNIPVYISEGIVLPAYFVKYVSIISIYGIYADNLYIPCKINHIFILFDLTPYYQIGDDVILFGQPYYYVYPSKHINIGFNVLSIK